MQRIVIMSLVCSLAGSSLFAQTLHSISGRPERTGATRSSIMNSSIDRAVATELAAQRGGNGPMPPAFLWTGVGLLAAGGATMVAGAVTDRYEVTCLALECVNNRKARLWGGAALLVAGGVVLYVGHSKRGSRPQILTGPGRIGLKQTIKF
jgi:hypothetical protein